MPITFNGVTPTQATVAKWDMYEAIIDLSAAYTNPYDYTDIAVQAIFTSPTGVQRTADAFWMQDYVIDLNTGALTPTGTAAFRVRFTPDEQGQWSYILSGSLQGGAPVTSAAYSFTCSGISASGKGYIRKTNTSYLRWDSGAQYIPVGENIAYPNTDVILDYNKYLDKLEPTGVNFIRIWMATWGVALEWTNVGGLTGFDKLKQYKQTAAKQIDYLLNRGQTNGYAIMLCINYHNQFIAGDEWQNNPYNTVQGGPCSEPLAFYSNSTAKDIFKNRLRYLVARWGYAGSLQSWELFNEVDNTPYYKSRPEDEIQFDNSAVIDQWHNEMAGYLKSIDPYHLVTSSFGNEIYGDGTWSSTNIDFTQVHKYKDDPRMPRLLANLNQQRLSAYSKPVLDGEFGMIVYADQAKLVDPNGISMHNVMWATLLSGAMGAAIPWWEHWVDDQNLYPHFSRLSAFKDIVPFVSGNYRKALPTYLNTNPTDLTVVPEGMWPDKYGNPKPVFDFTLDNEGELTPGLSQLSQFVWGNTNNTTLRRPPTFHVNYLQNGSFALVTANDISESGGRVNIYVDGVQVLDQAAQTNTTYTVPVSAGPHTIKVDNLGTDWILVSQFRFINAVGPLNLYFLKSADNSQAAGYILYRLYSHQYFSNGNTTPPPTVPAGAIVNIPGMNNGTYTINFYSCAAAATSTPAQPIATRVATAVNNVLTFGLPELPWDISFTATLSSSTPNALSSAVSVSPTLGWAASTAPVFTVNNAGITPGTSSLGMFVYGSQANTQYRNPSTFIVNYAQTGYFEVRTAATISSGSPRVTVYVDGVKLLDQAAVVNTSYAVAIPAGLHSITVDNLGGDWVQVDHYSFVPSLASGLPAPGQTASARSVVPGYPWGSKPPVNSFTLGADGTLTPDASNLAMYVYGKPAHPEYYNPATINVNFPQNGYLKLTTGASVSQNARVSVYVDGIPVIDQTAIANLSYVAIVTAGTHNITIDNLGGDWFLLDALVFDVL